MSSTSGWPLALLACAVWGNDFGTGRAVSLACAQGEAKAKEPANAFENCLRPISMFGCTSNHLVDFQVRQLGICVVQYAAQHLVGMLAQQGWWHVRTYWRSTQFNGARHQTQIAFVGVIPVRHHAARLNLRVHKHFGQIVDRTARYLGSFQCNQPVCQVPRHQ